MSESASLPFCIPWFSFTHAHAAPGLAMMGHPTAYNTYLNQCTTLNCTRYFLNGFTSPQISMPRGGLYAINCLERYGVTARFGYLHYKEIIKHMIDEGYYVCFSGVDDFYLPGKSWYGIRHMNHDGIICGYDESDHTYSIAAYDSNWLFRLIRIPQECFMEGVIACIEKKQFGELVAYRMRDTVVQLDENMIFQYLKDYISKTIDRFSLQERGEVDGIAVQNFLAMYMDKLKDGSIPSDKMDWRALRPVWEHKRCMLDRIKAIESAHDWDLELSTLYAPLVEDANLARMMFAMYHKNQKPILLDKIKNSILAFKDKEFEILSELIKRMEADRK